MDDPIVIVSYARTPLGAFQGVFNSIRATELGSTAIRAVLERAKLSPDQVQEVVMGCVLPAGLGQAPARQAALGAGIANSTHCSTVNKVCGSGMKAVMNVCDTLQANPDTVQIAIAGGMESMTNAPYFLDKARSGYRLGNAQLYDHMYVDGLEDAYSQHKLMGAFADETAASLGISRDEQDAFALRSLSLAQQAIKNDWFKAEICQVTVTNKSGAETVSIDECPMRAKPERIPELKPAFRPNGTVTAANSSSIADGASALLLMRASIAKKLAIKPVARIIGYTSFAREPEGFTLAPIGAIEQLLARTNYQLSQIDLFEINEAFAVVVLAAIKTLNLDINKINIHGGACALGHPIGASGARIICTLISALQQQGKKTGIATLCIGGGEATAILLELS